MGNVLGLGFGTYIGKVVVVTKDNVFMHIRAQKPPNKALVYKPKGDSLVYVTILILVMSKV